MKAIFIGVFLMFVTSLFACDHCGIYVNMQPNDFSHHIGFTYSRSIFSGIVPQFTRSLGLRHGDEATIKEYQGTTVRDDFQSMELRARYSFNQRFFVWGRLPIVDNARYVNDKLESKTQGFGDPILLGGYNIINSKSTDTTGFRHRLEVGAGIKFPMGATQAKYEDAYVDHDMQLGTGSYDAVFSMNYVAFLRQVGVTNQAMYRWNGANLNEYTFGSVFRDQLALLAQFPVKSWTLMPRAGVTGEWHGVDKQRGEVLANSGAERFMWSVGMEIVYKSVSLSGTFMSPFYENLTGDQFGQQNTTNFNIKYFFR